MPEALQTAQDQSRAAVSALAKAIRALITTPDWPHPIRTAKELERASGLSHRVAWQLHRFAMSDDPLAEAGHLPKRAAFARLCSAAEDAGASPARLREARRAFDATVDLVTAVSGDRDTFTEMASAWSGTPPDSSVKRHLREAYRSNRHVWGICAEASLMTMIALPDRTRWGLVRALCSLKSSRGGPWDLLGRNVSSIPNEPMTMATQDGTNLIERYCEGHVPALEQRQEADWLFVTGHFGVTGEAAPASLVFGERVPQPEDLTRARLFAQFPVERMQLEILSHRSLGATLGHHDLYVGTVPGSRRLSAVPVDFVHRDNADHAPLVREMDAYPSLLADILGEDGYTLDDFESFRVSCAHPPMGAVLELTIAHEHASAQNDPNATPQ